MRRAEAERNEKRERIKMCQRKTNFGPKKASEGKKK